MQEKDSKGSFVNCIIKHRKKSITIILLFYVISTLLLCRFVPYENDTEFNLNSLELSAEITSFIFIVFSVLIATIQYCASYRIECQKNEKESIQKSIDLIKYYKDNVLTKIHVITFIFKQSGIKNILSCIDNSKIMNFDTHELNQLLTQDKISLLKKKEKSKEFLESILLANEAFCLDLPGITYRDDVTNPYKKCASFDPMKVTNAFLASYISDTLNNLEYFSMHFTHKTADESVIYQSAHQTFISIVELLYYVIAEQNEPTTAKFYTNTISLYNTWKKRKAQQDSSIIENQRNIVEPGTIASKFGI